MSHIYDVYRWIDNNTPGRKDIDGIEWWACDPMATWYRWENGELFTKYDDNWPADDPRIELTRAIKEEHTAELALSNARQRVQVARDAVTQNTGINV